MFKLDEEYAAIRDGFSPQEKAELLAELGYKLRYKYSTQDVHHSRSGVWIYISTPEFYTTSTSTNRWGTFSRDGNVFAAGGYGGIPEINLSQETAQAVFADILAPIKEIGTDESAQSVLVDSLGR